MITIKGINDAADRGRVALAIISTLGIFGVCGRDPAVMEENCTRWFGNDDCRRCAVENYIKFED